MSVLLGFDFAYHILLVSENRFSDPGYSTLFFFFLNPGLSKYYAQCIHLLLSSQFLANYALCRLR